MKYIEFFRALAANNNREWFAAHRPAYDELRARWTAEIQRLIDAMAQYEPSFAHLQAKDCLYRINRNLRFSPDKTPYKTFFSALISPVGRHYDKAAYYVHAGIDENGLYAGLWSPETPVLKKLRHAIVDNIEEFNEIVENPEFAKEFPGWFGRRLKTIPQGWPKDHPQAELLRLQEYGKFHSTDSTFFERKDWPERAAELFSLAKPFNDFLNYSIDE